MPPIDLIIFDCDGVLIDSEVISANMLVAELAEHGVKIDLSYVARNFLGRSYPTVISQIRQEFGLQLSDNFEAAYRQRLLDAFATDLKIIPGVEDVLNRLCVPYCLATSSSPSRLKMSLEIVGLTEAFDGRTTTASEVANGKPAPDLFLLVAQKSGVDPRRCLVIEDSFAGIKAAKAANMQTWRFRGGSHLQDIAHDEASDLADREFASYADFFQGASALMKRQAHE